MKIELAIHELIAIVIVILLIIWGIYLIGHIIGSYNISQKTDDSLIEAHQIIVKMYSIYNFDNIDIDNYYEESKKFLEHRGIYDW